MGTLARTHPRALALSAPAPGCKPIEGGLKRCLPRLIIMGQFKCGTTALFDTLAQHPDLLLPHTKEPNQIKCPRRQPTCVIKEVNGARSRSALGPRLV